MHLHGAGAVWKLSDRMPMSKPSHQVAWDQYAKTALWGCERKGFALVRVYAAPRTHHD